MLPAILLFAATYVLMLTFSKYRPYIALASGLIFIFTGMLPVQEILQIMLPAILLFAATYVLMLTFSKYRPYIALASGLIFIFTGMLPVQEILPALDFNVLLMIGGTMGLVQLFIDSHMPERMADMIMEKVPNVQWAAVALSLFAGVISAFVDNVATVLMVAPVALEICKKLKTNPVPILIAIAVSSNLQGAATLVGDTTAIMLGSALDMSFMDFFWYQGKPSIFFAVELGAVLSAAIVYFLFRKEKGSIPKTGTLTPVNDYVPTVLLLGAIGLLICASFAPDSWNLPAETNGIICCTLLVVGTPVNDYVPTVLLLGAIGLLICASFAPDSWNLPAETNGIICCTLLVVGLIYNFCKKKHPSAVSEPLMAIDFETLGLLVGLFLMIGGISCTLLVVGLIYNFCKKKHPSAVSEPLMAIDFETLGLLVGLFLMIGGISNMGVIDALAAGLAKLGGGNVFLMFTIIVWASVLISAFIDNIPYVATMIPVIAGLAHRVGFRADFRIYRQHPLCGHHDPRDCRSGLPDGLRPHAPVLRSPLRRHPGRQHHPHRRFRQHHRHWHPAAGGQGGQEFRLLQNHAPVLRSPLRRHPGRQHHPHRRFRQHHRHWHPAAGGQGGQEFRLLQNWHSLHPVRHYSCLHLHLAGVRRIIPKKLPCCCIFCSGTAFLWAQTKNDRRGIPRRRVTPNCTNPPLNKSGGFLLLAAAALASPRRRARWGAFRSWVHTAR